MKKQDKPLKPIKMADKIKKLSTPKGKSYWDGNGIYQKEYEKFKDKLVPNKGEADTVNGEIIRSISRLFYEFCNNGNCNAIEHEQETETCTCPECSGSGQVTEYNEETEEDEDVDCSECGGSGESEEDVNGDPFISEYYKKMVDFLEEKLTNKKVIENIRAFLLDKNNGYGTYKFNEKEMSIYNKLCDEAIYQCLITKNVARKINKD